MGARAQFVLQRFQRLGAGARQHHARALAMQRLGDGAADAAGGAGDERDFVGQIKESHAVSFCFSVVGSLMRTGGKRQPTTQARPLKGLSSPRARAAATISQLNRLALRPLRKGGIKMAALIITAFSQRLRCRRACRARQSQDPGRCA